MDAMPRQCQIHSFIIREKIEGKRDPKRFFKINQKKKAPEKENEEKRIPVQTTRTPLTQISL